MHILVLAVALTSSPHNLLWISGAIGVFLPHLIAIVNQSHWSSGLKAVIAAAACLVAAAIVCWTRGQINFSDWLTSAGVVFTFATTTYKGLWKPTGVIDALESSTTMKSPSAP